MTRYDDPMHPTGGTDPGDAFDARPLAPEEAALLRAALAPPGGEAYWDALESRVMQRVLGRTTTEWWQVMGEWARSAAVAAAVAILVASALLLTTGRPTAEPDLAVDGVPSLDPALVDEPLAFSFDVAPPRASETPINATPLPGVLPR